MAFEPVFNLADLDGNNGFVINGIDGDDGSGISVSSAGDINGDGIDDLIIDASGAQPNGNDGAGESYIVFGRAEGFDAALELSALDGSNGFVINGIDERDFSGSSVSGAGDINGDGLADLIIGAPLAAPNGKDRAGESYVVFGQAEGFEAAMELSALDGRNGFVINGIDADDESGSSVSGAGDINGDGLADLIIGAEDAAPNGKDRAGESYVVFGRSGGFEAALELSALDGTNGFVINGIDERDRSGLAVSSAGDVNGDGLDDLIIGAYGADPNGNNGAGESYVVFGQAEDFETALELSQLDGSNGFVINGIGRFDFSGFAVSSAGDINGDGLDDLIIGAFFADPNGNNNAGESYVVFGRAEGFEAAIELSALDGTNGFVINGIDERDRSGLAVSSAGDVNG
ncbi:MAG: integrin alpha, partial [Leptolyngbyaceae cyanobacterium]